jgi:uncharacterized protein YjdB
VESIGQCAFGATSSLAAINVSGQTPYYASNDGVLFDKNKQELVMYPQGKVGSYAIPNGVKRIGEDAFQGCDSLTSVIIPGSVTDIGNMAFRHCLYLLNVTMSNGVKTIGHNAFQGCDSLVNIEIPNSVTSIEYSAFWACHSLTAITIPRSVTSIGNGAFDGCDSLTIRCYEGSVAHGYAIENRIDFEFIKDPVSIALDSITLNRTALDLYIDEAAFLAVDYFPANATEKPVAIWTTSNPGVATVNDDGEVLGRAEGTATITASVNTASGTKTATCELTVKKSAIPPSADPYTPPTVEPVAPATADSTNPPSAKPSPTPATKITTPLKTVYLKKGAHLIIPVVAYTSDDKTAVLTWTSSNTNTATVNQSGKVTAKKKGIAKITAKAQNGKSVTITVKVVDRAKKPTKLSITGVPGTLKIGKTAQIKVKVTPTDATNLAITFKSSKSSVLGVDKAGKLTAKKKGKATITVKAGGKSVKKMVTVK